jgi:hypothetical protein
MYSHLKQKCLGWQLYPNSPTNCICSFFKKLNCKHVTIESFLCYIFFVFSFSFFDEIEDCIECFLSFNRYFFMRDSHFLSERLSGNMVLFSNIAAFNFEQTSFKNSDYLHAQYTSSSLFCFCQESIKEFDVLGGGSGMFSSPTPPESCKDDF